MEGQKYDFLGGNLAKFLFSFLFPSFFFLSLCPCSDKMNLEYLLKMKVTLAAGLEGDQTKRKGGSWSDIRLLYTTGIKKNIKLKIL